MKRSRPSNFPLESNVPLSGTAPVTTFYRFSDPLTVSTPAPFANSNRVIAMTPLLCAWSLCTDWSRPRKPLRCRRPEQGPSWNSTPQISRELRPPLSPKQKRSLTRKNLSQSKQASWIIPCTSLFHLRACEDACGTPSLPEIAHGAAVLTSAWHIPNQGRFGRTTSRRKTSSRSLQPQ
jgi:hypothetical protein